jgi:hypothetical protein
MTTPAGSNPAAPTINNKGLRIFRSPLFTSLFSLGNCC